MTDSGLTPLLDLPASEAAATIVRGHLQSATSALERMKDKRDAEALHDFRVAVRRLRCALRAYRPWLGPAAGRKIRRRLRDLGAITNAGRDAEVQLAWIAAHRDALTRGERSGYNWFAKRRRDARRAGYNDARRWGREDFEKVAATIGERLREPEAGAALLREVFASLLLEHVGELETRLGAVHGSGEQRAVHDARIQAKRLRYLLEPLRPEMSAIKAVLRPLKALQDILGDLHDVHVLDAQLSKDLDEIATEKAHRLRELAIAGDSDALARERRRDERLGLVRLIACARSRREELFAELAGTWLTEPVPAMIGEARALAASMAPSTIPVERERKYLLNGLPAEACAVPPLEVEQGWIPGRTLRERLRRVRDESGERFYRTIKLGSGVERIEIEEETTAEVFAAMWPLTEGCRIAKRRHCVPVGGLVWEIDEFTGRDLVMAEVELESVDQVVPIPGWLQPFLVREVTDDPAYLNLSLASCAA